MKRRRITEKITAVFAVIFAVVLNTIIALADGEGETTAAAPDISVVTKPLEIIKILSISVIATIGVILIAWAILEIAQALMAHDTSQIGLALRRLAAGSLCAGISILLALMGF